MSTASLVLFILSAILTLCGLPCCLGCLNWIAVPLSLMTAVVGLVGLITDRDPVTKRSRDVGIHLLALIGGLVLVMIGSFRCCVGGGLVRAALPIGHGGPPIWRSTQVSQLRRASLVAIPAASEPLESPLLLPGFWHKPCLPPEPDPGSKTHASPVHEQGR